MQTLLSTPLSIYAQTVVTFAPHFDAPEFRAIELRDRRRCAFISPLPARLVHNGPRSQQQARSWSIFHNVFARRAIQVDTYVARAIEILFH